MTRRSKSKSKKKPQPPPLLRERSSPLTLDTFKMGVLPQVLRLDERLGHFFFLQKKKSAVLSAVAEVVSLSADELIFFGVTSGLAISMSLVRGVGYFRDMGCVEEAIWDCFGGCTACTLVESILKLFFQRTRPKYIEQSKHVSIIGEGYSFPSGHALRAFYLVFYFSRSNFFSLLQPLISIPRARVCIPWAFAVAWSRVAKGKHFPLDVVFGAIIGFALGWFVEDYVSGYVRAAAKTVGGIFTVANWAYFMLIPFLAGDDRKKIIIATVIFYIYCLSLLFTTLPMSQDVAGAQSIEYLDDGHVCKNLW